MEKIDSLLFELARRTLPCLHKEYPTPFRPMCILRILSTLAILFSGSFYTGCSDDTPAPEQKAMLPPAVEEKSKVAEKTPKSAPVVYIEELDQFQEYFKEQHETSFSHVTKKNWTSYTAGKDGILTKILLFGKPNYTISEHYGDSMSGFVRADNPDSGPKLGEWSLTREEIVNQLALQGLTETDRGWITLQMRGEIPQQAGRMYFIVCDKIGNKRAWFGAFAFAEGNSYKKGRFWLHPDHDLVFRTYVGKTSEQLEKEQRGQPLFDSDTASLVPVTDLPEAPKPMIELSKNFEPRIPPVETSPAPIPLDEEPTEPLYQPATIIPAKPVGKNTPHENIEASEKADSPTTAPDKAELSEPQVNPQEASPDTPEAPKKGTLFERFFKNKTE